jgi:hypothetical protein
MHDDAVIQPFVWFSYGIHHDWGDVMASRREGISTVTQVWAKYAWYGSGSQRDFRVFFVLRLNSLPNSSVSENAHDDLFRTTDC